MPKVIFLPNEEFCPEGMVVDAAAGDNLLEVAHNAGVEIHHACDGSCACTTCVVGDEDLVVEIPKYNINHANEAAH